MLIFFRQVLNSGLLTDKLFLVLIFLISIGLYQVFYFFSGESSKNFERQEKSIDHTRRFEEEASYFLKPPFFYLPALRIPVFKNKKIIAYVHIKLEMEAKTQEIFRRVQIFLPALVDAIFTDLYISLSSLWFEGKTPSQNILKGRLYDTSNKIFGKGAIKNIYIRQIYVDKFNDF